MWANLMVLLLLCSTVAAFHGASVRAGLRLTRTRDIEASHRLLLLHSESAVVISKTSPIPKVPKNAWKWPPVWPFPEDALDVVLPEPDLKLSKVYTEAQTNKIKEHMQAFVSRGAAILEIGVEGRTLPGLASALDAATVSDFQLGKSAVDKDPTTLRSLQFHAPAFSFDDESMDVVLVTSGIDLMTNPRDVFREIWRVLRPGGRCIVSFAENPAQSPALFPTKMWTTMTDEQKIWIVGSYFQYSAGAGWRDIEGYDLFRISDDVLKFDDKPAAEENGDVVSDCAYIVQASKLPRDFKANLTLYDKLSYELLPANFLEADDKEYSALRLAADVEHTSPSPNRKNKEYEERRENEEEKEEYVLARVKQLPKIYEIISCVKDVVIPSAIKASLANALLLKWTNSDAQRDALRKGLGLEADDIWRSIGACTSQLPPRSKIHFLSEIIPEFGINPRIEKLPVALEQITSALEERFNDDSDDGDVDAAIRQRWAAEIVTSEFLLSERTDALDRILRFVREKLTKEQLRNH